VNLGMIKVLRKIGSILNIMYGYLLYMYFHTLERSEFYTFSVLILFL